MAIVGAKPCALIGRNSYTLFSLFLADTLVLLEVSGMQFLLELFFIDLWGCAVSFCYPIQRGSFKTRWLALRCFVHFEVQAYAVL